MDGEAARRPTHGWNKRFILGVVILFVVDVIWVVSAELSEYIYHDADFNKPFFTTYVKTSMFVVYLFGFVFVKRWQHQLRYTRKSTEDIERLLNEIERLDETRSSSTSYSADQIIPPTHGNMSGDHTVESSLRNARTVDVRFLSQMSPNEITELRTILTQICNKFSLQKTMKIALYFVVLWVLATLMYQEALSQTSAAVTNILSSTSGIFTLLMAAMFPSSVNDKFNVSKLLAVCVSFGGIFLICWTDPNRKESGFNFGDLYSLLGAILYACYLVMIRKHGGEKDELDIPLFLGFVGLLGLLLLWPVFFILHYTGIETFKLPAHDMTWIYIILNGIIGTAISELLWLWGCFLTSSLMATLSLGLVTPMTMIWDIAVNHIKFSTLFFVGTVPVVLSFIAVIVLTHYGDWDPVRDVIMKCLCCRGEGMENNEEKERLLGSDGGGVGNA